jgi:glycine/D-amino acid oxidase-like deaminating enzyme
MARRLAIVGAGLAGCTLAWMARFAEWEVVLFDRDDPHAASKAAAGLITPVTGLRWARSYRFEQWWPVARDFYRRVEAVLGEPLLFEHPAIRIFLNDDEKRLCETKTATAAKHGIGEFVRPVDELPAGIIAPLGGVEFEPAGHLAVERYVLATRRAFHAVATDIVPGDVLAGQDSAWVGGERFDFVTFCQGFAGASNPWFPDVAFNPTRGEVLTVEIDDFDDGPVRVLGSRQSRRSPRTIHKGGWLLRTAPGRFAVGSTYDRIDLSPSPTAAGRAEIEGKLKATIDRPYRVVDHRAGVRPTIVESQPTIAVSPKSPRVWILNGLGSKGSLAAPAAAGILQSRFHGMITEK